MNLAETLHQHARTRGSHPAVVSGDRVVTYSEFNDDVMGTASYLCSLGLQPGDTVAVSLRDSVEHLTILFALARAGLVLQPIDWRWAVEEQESAALHFGAKIVLVESDQDPLVSVPTISVDAAWRQGVSQFDSPPDLPQGKNLPFVMSLSSGTTGRPKGPVLTHEQFYSRFRVFWVNLGLGSRDRFLSSTPLYYGGGRAFAMTVLYSGGTVILFPPPYGPEELCAIAAEHDATSVFLVPTLLRRLLALDDATLAPIHRMHVVISSGAALHAYERRIMLKRFGAGFVQYYSSTEGGGVSFLAGDDPEQFDGSVGRPVLGVEVECVDLDDLRLPANVVGRIRYRGPGTATSFFNDPEASALSFRDGWFYPGDLGMIDEHGYLYIKGRSKDMIIRGGVNIYPADVEAVLADHPAVQESAVVGWPSQEFNEEVAAFVTLKYDVAVTELNDLCAQHLARYKRPREIFIREDFPRNNLGKVIKTDLVALLPNI